MAQGFFDAITNGNLERIKVFLQEDPDLLFADHDYYGSSARLAVDRSKTEVTDYLAHEILRRIEEGSIGERDLYGAIHDLGEIAHSETGYGLSEQFRAIAEPAVVRFLSHEDESLRSIALNVLGLHWNAKSHRDTFAEAMFTDRSSEARRLAAACLGSVLRESRDWEATGLLLRKVADQNEEHDVRETAYGGLLDVWFGWRAHHKFFLKMLYVRAPIEFWGREASDREDYDRSLRFLEQADQLWEEHIDRDFIAKLERGEEP